MELLSHIAVTHQVAVAGLGKDDEALGRGSTITRRAATRPRAAAGAPSR
jgi:hypothetical protein